MAPSKDDVAIAINVGSGDTHTSVRRRQTIVQRDGRTSVSTTETTDTGGSTRMERDQQELSAEELEQQGGEELPDREAMSLVNANVAAPVNAAAALNVLSDSSTATADATQTADIDQSN